MQIKPLAVLLKGFFILLEIQPYNDLLYLP